MSPGQQRFLTDFRNSFPRPLGVPVEQAGDPPSTDGALQRPEQDVSPATIVRRVHDPLLGTLVAEIRILPPKPSFMVLLRSLLERLRAEQPHEIAEDMR